MKILRLIANKWHIFLALIIGLIIFDFTKFLDPILNFTTNFNQGTFFKRYNLNNIEYYIQFVKDLQDTFIDIILYFKEFDTLNFLMEIIRILVDILIYVVNYGLNLLLILYILYYIFISNDVYEVKNTKHSIALNRLVQKIRKLKEKIKNLLKYLTRYKIKYVQFIVITTFFSGILVTVLLEIIIFIILYFKSSFDLETHLVLLQIFQFFITFTLKNVPKIFVLLLFFVWFIYISYTSAMKKLQKNHDALKVIAKHEMSFINIITGPPGSGKTRSVVALSLASVENFIDEIEEKLLDIEIQNPDVNFGEIELDPYQHINNFPEHHYFCSLKNAAKSMIASAPFSILDPYADDYSLILDFDYIRPNSKCDDVPLEEYKVIAISELDKEYNSHYNKAEVGEDGLHLFFGTVSHWLKRHGRIYIDYQQPTQVPLNVRGNAETFFHINKAKLKMPVLLNLCSMPFKLLFRFTYKTIDLYSFYKQKITKTSLRSNKRVRKRYDYNTIFALLRHLTNKIYRIVSWFDTFTYTQISGSISNVEGEVRSKIKLRINSRDEKYKDSYLYDSTFLSKGYENKRSKSKTTWNSADSFQSIHPSDEELKKMHSRFIDKAFFNFENTNTDEKQEPNKSDNLELKF